MLNFLNWTNRLVIPRFFVFFLILIRLTFFLILSFFLLLNLRDFFLERLPNLELIDRTRWYSNTKRVSNYCIEGERGFIHSNQTSEHHYYDAVKKLFGV